MAIRVRNATKGKVIKGIALALDVGGPLVATLTQFPIWIDRSSGATMSGLFLVFAFLSALPFFRQIKEYFKSPSAPVVWSVLFAFFVCLRNIVDEMLVVALFGMIFNLIGAGVYKLGQYVGDKPDEEVVSDGQNTAE